MDQEENTTEAINETAAQTDVTQNEETPVQISPWRGLLNQILFLAGGILFFMIINYIFGFMKGN